MNVHTLGIDIGKSTFHLFGLGERAQPVLRRQLSRPRLMAFIGNLPCCLIGMEACAGSHHLARQFTQMGHTVRLMAPHFVVPYRKSNKSDFLDAEAIAEAVTRPTMRFVPIKSVEQQDIQALHRARSQLVGQRTATVNQVRAFLAEFGITRGAGIKVIRKALPEILDNADNTLSTRMRGLIAEWYALIRDLDQRIERLNVELEQIAAQHPACQRLMTIPGVGVLTATALVASVGNAGAFSNARALSAWIGLVPRQYSTGGKPRLLGIGRRGQVYLRTLFIHGARALYYRLDKGEDAIRRTGQRLRERTHKNVVIVAVANKLARIAWAVLYRNSPFRNTGPEACAV